MRRYSCQCFITVKLFGTAAEKLTPIEQNVCKSKIVYKKSSMCTDGIISKLGWQFLSGRRKHHLQDQDLDPCPGGKASAYFHNYLKVRYSGIHSYST